MKIRGMGGWLTLEEFVAGAAQAQPVLQHTVQHNFVYELVVRAELRESRTVGCGGFAEGLLKFKRVEYVLFKVCEDDLLYPEIVGFRVGREIPVLLLKRGELNKVDRVTRTIVQSVRKVNDQVKARRVEVMCRFGAYQMDLPAPPAARTPEPDTGDEE